MGEKKSEASRPKSMAIIYIFLAILFLWLGPGFAGGFEPSSTILGIVYVFLIFFPRDSESTVLLVSAAFVGLIGFVAGIVFSIAALDSNFVDPVGSFFRALLSIPALIPVFDVIRSFGLAKRHT